MKLEEYLTANSMKVQVSLVNTKEGGVVFRVSGNKKVKKQINRTYDRTYSCQSAGALPIGEVDSKDLIEFCESNLFKIKVA